MNYSEEIATFECADAWLMGILARPERPLATGVLIIVGGPQYRVGSHRQFVQLSRSLAEAGYAVLRFDYRGMGDSAGERRDFEATRDDIGAAINALQQHVPAVRQLALWGLCDGASAALLYCFETLDTRVSALCLVNPWVRTDASQARTRLKHYYLNRLMRAGFWVKLLRGGVPLGALAGLAGSAWLALRGGERQSSHSPGDSAALPFQQRMAAAWSSFSGRIFLLLSDNDYIAREFLEHAGKDRAWRAALKHPRLVRHTEPGANHTFSSAALRARATELTLRHGLYSPREEV